MKIKVNDKVLIIAGKYKGKTGKVMRVLKKRNHVVVEKVNIRTRHIKKTATAPGQRLQYEASFNASNVMVLCPKTDKPTRVGYKMTDGGKKIRIAKRSGEPLDTGFLKTTKK